MTTANRGLRHHLRHFAKKDSIIRIAGEHVYIYDGDALTTVLSLPNQYRADMKSVLKECCTAQ